MSRVCIFWSVVTLPSGHLLLVIRFLFNKVKLNWMNTFLFSLKYYKCSFGVRPCLHGVGDQRSSGVGYFCFVSPRAWKQKKPTPLDRGPPLHVNRPLVRVCHMMLRRGGYKAERKSRLEKAGLVSRGTAILDLNGLSKGTSLWKRSHLSVHKPSRIQQWSSGKR